MEIKAAESIDRVIGRSSEIIESKKSKPGACKTPQERLQFKPNEGKMRKHGTGGIYQKNDHL